MDGEEVDQLVEQFSDYQLAPVEELPSCADDGMIEQFWGEMGNLTDNFSNTKRFGILGKVAKTLLILPNSNADSERAFSIIKKIHTEFRSDLNNETLCALLSCKFNQTVQCFDYKPSKDVLKAAKNAASDYNQSLK